MFAAVGGIIPAVTLLAWANPHVRGARISAARASGSPKAFPTGRPVSASGPCEEFGTCPWTAQCDRPDRPRLRERGLCRRRLPRTRESEPEGEAAGQ